MRVFVTQEEVNSALDKGGNLIVKDDLVFAFDVCIAGDITAGDITARNITAGDITARNIDAGNITAGDITACDITACDITACDIDAWNITAWDIDAGNITYYAICVSYKSITCTSIKAHRGHSIPLQGLDGKLTIAKK